MKVYIRHNNDTGEWLYSVEQAEDRDNWVDAFETEQEAINYCSENNLEILRSA